MNFAQETSRQIEYAAKLLLGGDLVALPSETVYGLGGRADHEDAVAKIFAAKSRPSFNPLIVHVHDITMAKRFAAFSPAALKLAQSFWPGALTLVLPRISDEIAPNVSAGLPTLALRSPAHPVFQAVIRATQIPIAAPSANSSGRLSPTTAQHVKSDLGDKVDFILDGGATHYGLESTVVQVDDDKLTLLRYGAISPEAITSATGLALQTHTHSNTPQSPGQLLRHYAPRARLILNASPKKLPAHARWVGFGDGSIHDLSPTKDLNEAAHRLFATLFELDETDQEIHIAPIPHEGIGIAINDRLKRAAQSGGQAHE